MAWVRLCAAGDSAKRSEKIADGMSVEPKGRYAAVVSATGLLRLYDLHVCRASRQTAHPKKLRVIPISAEAAEAALLAGEAAGGNLGGGGGGGGGDDDAGAVESFALPTALSKAPSKALLDAVFPPATGRAPPAWTVGVGVVQQKLKTRLTHELERPRFKH